MDDMKESEQNSNINHGAVLKELSDIKSSLAVTTSETANIKQSVNEIRSDVKDIKSDFVSRREYHEGIQSVRSEISPLRKFVYGIIALILIAFITALLRLVVV